VTANEEADSRRRQMLATAFGEAIRHALQDPSTIEIMVNPDGKLCEGSRV
jgi:Flp pilus assembly CpaF family ATPase